MTQTSTPEQRLKATRHTFACAMAKREDEPTLENEEAAVMRLTRWEAAIKDCAKEGLWDLLTDEELTMMAEDMDQEDPDIRTVCLGKASRKESIAAIIRHLKDDPIR